MSADDFTDGLTGDLERAGAAFVYRIAGQADVAAAEPLRLRLLDLLTEVPGDLVLNLAEVTFMDSAALAALLAVSFAARDQRRRVVLSRPSDAVLQLIELAGVERVLTIRRGDLHEHLDGAPAVHGGVAGGHVVEGHAPVEHGRGVEGAREDVGEQLGDVGTHRRDPPVQCARCADGRRAGPPARPALPRGRPRRRDGPLRSPWRTIPACPRTRARGRPRLRSSPAPARPPPRRSRRRCRWPRSAARSRGARRGVRAR